MLGTLPLVFLAELGVAVALGVLLDTMIVRSVLVTALNLDLGSRIWWPSKLDRGDHVVDVRTPAADRADVRVVSGAARAAALRCPGRAGPPAPARLA